MTINANLFSDDTLLALEEVDAIYEILKNKYEGMPTVLLATMLSAVMTRIDSDKSFFTALDRTHVGKRVWHPKHAFGKLMSFDDNGKVIVKFDIQDSALKLSPKVLMLAEGMDDPHALEAAAAAEQKSTPGANTGG